MQKRGRNTKTNTSLSKKSKHGQVTVFVILGIVLFVVFIFAIFVSSALAKLKIQGQANKAVDSYLASESINYYVYTCMDSAVTASIEELSLQGGTFFNYQGGPVKLEATDAGKTYIPYSIKYPKTEGGFETKYFNVSYSIQNRSYCDIVNTNVPDYPYKPNAFVSDLLGIYNNRATNLCLFNLKEGYELSGFAGFNNMTRLCKSGSPNIMRIGDVELSPCFNSVIKDPNRSTEYLLEKQISARMKECANFSVFKDDNITPFGDPVTKITYTTDSMFVETTYNLTVKIKYKDPVVVKHSFGYSTNLRFVRLHNYVMTLVTLDSQDFAFSIKDNYKMYSNSYTTNPAKFFDEDYMSVKVVNFSECTAPECAPYKYDQILIVQDNKSKIGNRSLTYITAIKNRIPALEYMHSTAPDSLYDIIVSENQEVILNPIGYDPDDRTPLGYKYEGWKEDYEDVCKIIPVTGEPFPKIQCTAYPQDMRNWSDSKIFRDTKKSANYTTNVSDMGIHNVTITISDVSGLVDYQIVKILVFDYPKPNITTIKTYNFDGASIEDQLELNSTTSSLSGVGGGSSETTTYIWAIYLKTDDTYEQVFFNRTKEKIIMVPTESYDLTLNQLIQRIKGLNLSDTGEHNVTLAMESYIPLINDVITTPAVYAKIDVKECFPLRNDADPYPYPYNSGANPFLASHKCCSDSYTFRSEDSKCFENTSWGELKTLQHLNLAAADKLTEYPADTNYIATAPPAGNKNDVYKMTFERFCDGERGNICAGPMKRTIVLDNACDDALAGQEETCSGPPNALSYIDIGCKKYSPGETFEKLFESGTGSCNYDRACSTIGSYGTGGPMYCDAKCDGAGHCTNAVYSSSKCSCSTLCDAECLAFTDFKRTGKQCEYGCRATTTCEYDDHTTLPCDGTECYVSSDASGYSGGYCYYNVKCAATYYPPSRGAYCKAGEIVDGNICLVQIANPNICSPSGECLLTRQPKPTAEAELCLEEEVFKCDSINGWYCSSSGTPHAPGVPADSV